MKLKFWQEKDSIYDEPIDTVLHEMKTYGPDTPEFQTQLSYLERLSELKTKTRSTMRVSPDTLLIVAGNFAAIGLIAFIEQSHPMTSKGMNFIKPKNP